MNFSKTIPILRSFDETKAKEFYVGFLEFKVQNMSMFRVSVTARNTKHEEIATEPVSAVVDTGSELTWLPADILRGIGITPRRKRTFLMANQQKIQRDVGYALLSAEGYETIDEVVFAESSDMSILGVRTLEGFGVMVDNIGHRFVPGTTTVASSPESQISQSAALIYFPVPINLTGPSSPDAGT